MSRTDLYKNKQNKNYSLSVYYDSANYIINFSTYILLMYKIEIHCSLDNIDSYQTPLDYPSWNVVCFIKNQKLICGRYSTPIEAGKAAQEMDSFFKFLSPDLKEKLKQSQN